MSNKPQQPELRRSGRGATDDDSAKIKAEAAESGDEPQGWVPPDNRPGHRPEKDQDKPDLTERNDQ